VFFQKKKSKKLKTHVWYTTKRHIPEDRKPLPFHGVENLILRMTIILVKIMARTASPSILCAEDKACVK